MSKYKATLPTYCEELAMKRTNKFSILAILPIALLAATTAIADSKKNHKSQKSETIAEAPVLDGSKRDDNRNDKKQEWYRGDLMGLDDD